MREEGRKVYAKKAPARREGLYHVGRHSSLVCTVKLRINTKAVKVAETRKKESEGRNQGRLNFRNVFLTNRSVILLSNL